MKKFLFVITLVAFTFGLAQIVLASNASDKAKTAEKIRLVTNISSSTPGYPALCLQNAIAAREDGVILAYNTRSTALSTAMQIRKVALVEAWGIADRTQRNKVRKAAWDNYNKARKVARASYNATNKNIWKTFHAAAKACGVSTKGVEPENMDQSLSD